MRIRRPRRSVLLALAGVTALVGVAGAFVAGLAVGRGDRPAPSVVDQAIAAVEAHGNGAHSTQALEASAVQGVVGGLGDTWAAYYGIGDGQASQDQLRALLDGDYSGLGLWLRRSGASSGIGVASVVAGSPAAAAGLVPGDELVAVGGVAVATESVDAVTAALRGPAGSSVSVTVDTAAGTERTLALIRRDVSASDVTTSTLAPGVLDIRIAEFSAGTGAQVEQAVRAAQVQHARGIVLDLRGNPGGLLPEAVSAASAFLDGGPVVRLSGRTVPAQTLDARTGGDTTTPLAVLVDGGTASAAEILAGALQDRGRGVIVGSRTFGKGSVQRVVPLSDGSSFELTVATYTTPDGHTVDHVGITPDVLVPADAPPAAAATRALALLSALSATSGS